MSTRAKSTLASTIAVTIGTVYFVHFQQKSDKAVRHLAQRHVTIVVSMQLPDKSANGISRQCTKESSAIWSNNVSSASDRPTSKYNDSWRRSTARCRTFLTPQMDEMQTVNVSYNGIMAYGLARGDGHWIGTELRFYGDSRH
jgi:hypothetical protein